MRTIPRPSELDLYLFDSALQNFEQEAVARNLYKLALHTNDEWDTFTWESYCDFCSHTPTNSELAIIEFFAEHDYLHKSSDTYTPTLKLISIYILHSKNMEATQ